MLYLWYIFYKAQLSICTKSLEFLEGNDGKLMDSKCEYHDLWDPVLDGPKDRGPLGFCCETS